MRPVLVVVAYIALAALALGANPFKGEVVGPFDLLAWHGGWSVDEQVEQVRSRERSDIIDSLLPNWTQAREQIRSGIVPLWNPLQAAGQGALFDPTRSLFSVAFLLFLLCPSPVLGFYFGVLSSLAIGGAGMHFLVSRHCGRIPSFFAGISYMMCGFFAAWLFWPHTLSGIWIPWLLLAVDRCVAKPTWGAVSGVAAATAMMFLGGFPFVVAIGLGAAIVHLSVSVLAARPGWHFPRLAVPALSGIGLGLALCAIPILGLVAMLQHMDVSYRAGFTPFNMEHVKLLSRPWAAAAPRVESNMYVGMLALAFSLFALPFLFTGRLRAIAVSAFVYVVVGFVLVFGILPQEVGAKLPILSGNPWHRSILLLDIGIIILAAAGLDRLLARVGPGKLSLTLGLIFVVVQYGDLLQVFRKFNGPTPARYYYRVEDHVAALSDSIGPFQYVLQDGRHFQISGTLAAVGLGDWFGHSLRSPRQRWLLAQLAEKPFSSPTSTSVLIDTFRLGSPRMDVTASCYFIYPSVGSQLDVVAKPKEGERFALPPINQALVAQEVGISKSIELLGFSMRFATYHQVDLDGEIEVQVYRLSDGERVAESVLPAAAVADNEVSKFRFADTPVLEEGRYSFVVAYRPGPAAKDLTIWAFRTGDGLAQGGQAVAGASADYAVHGQGVDSSAHRSFEVVADSGVTAIAKNEGCPAGPYWTANVGEPAMTMDDRVVEVARYSPHSFELSVDAPADGYVVIPMNYQPGWRGWVNGEQRNFDLVYGVMPALRVNRGESTVEMRYAPPRWRLGAAISAGALALFCAVAVLLRVLRRRALA
ncbi:YfhO family protein [Luteimonas sp. Y-2-2-4F]|nr:YfhO family protein [Luteimonas sp. Y-2-2-4F]MCD9031665.1 YfhO family protein [Luteimonas sp. Y-2-2-4F]